MQSTVDNVRGGSARTAMLVGGDVVALMVFAAIGRNSHGEPIGVEAIGKVAYTAAPFLIGWLLSAPFLGAFSPRSTDTLLKMLRATALSWCAALVVGALVRALLIGRFSPFSFYVVTFLVALLILCGWRSAFSVWEARRS
ncbi:MAG: DUF3054 domain-containing protein [Oscillochloris sp.]|nr:DUF3054 domain-containing protein [Oscillochloris sp.]